MRNREIGNNRAASQTYQQVNYFLELRCVDFVGVEQRIGTLLQLGRHIGTFA